MSPRSRLEPGNDADRLPIMTASSSSRPSAGHGMSNGRSLIGQAFGDVLEGARKRRDLSAKEVAARAGISVQRLHIIEHARMEPRLDQLYRVADALGVSRTWMIDEVIDWLVPHAYLSHDAVEGAQTTDQEARFIHQLICGVYTPIRRSPL